MRRISDPGPTSLFVVDLVESRIYSNLRQAHENRKIAMLELHRKVANEDETLHRTARQKRNRPRDRGVVHRDVQLLERDANEVHLHHSRST